MEGLPVAVRSRHSPAKGLTVSFAFRDQRSPRAKLIKTALIIALITGVLLAGFSIWNGIKEQRQRNAALGALLVSFRKQNSLTVFQAQVPVFVRSSERVFFNTLERSQFGVVPARVDYKLNLANLSAESFRWDSQTETMSITLQDVEVSEPVLDVQRAQFVNKGFLMTVEAAQRLLQKNLEVARVQALQEARSPLLTSLAHTAAKEAMARNVLLPLQVAGFSKATVSIRFASEGSTDPSFLDASRPIPDVLKDAEKKRNAN